MTKSDRQSMPLLSAVGQSMKKGWGPLNDSARWWHKGQPTFNSYLQDKRENWKSQNHLETRKWPISHQQVHMYVYMHWWVNICAKNMLVAICHALHFTCAQDKPSPIFLVKFLKHITLALLLQYKTNSSTFWLLPWPDVKSAQKSEKLPWYFTMESIR